MYAQWQWEVLQQQKEFQYLACQFVFDQPMLPVVPQRIIVYRTTAVALKQRDTVVQSQLQNAQLVNRIRAPAATVKDRRALGRRINALTWVHRMISDLVTCSVVLKLVKETKGYS